MSAESSQIGRASVGQDRVLGRVRDSDHRALCVIGGVLLLGSLVVGLVYSVDFDFAAYTTFRGTLHSAEGTVTAVEPTDTFEPGTRWSHRDERTRIVAVRYALVDP